MLDYQNNKLCKEDNFAIEKKMYGENTLFSLSINDSILDLMPLVDSLAKPYFQVQRNQDLDDLSIIFKHEGYACELEMDQISLNSINGRTSFYFKNPTFLFRKE